MLIFGIWTHVLSIFDPKFGFYVKFHPYSQMFRSNSFSTGQNLSMSFLLSGCFKPHHRVNKKRSVFGVPIFCLLDTGFPNFGVLWKTTWLEALGPEQFTIWVKFYVESEFQVENIRFLHPDLEKQEKRT